MAGPDSNSGALDRVLLGCYAAGCLTCAYLSILSFSAEAGYFCELAGTDCVGVIGSGYGRILGLSVATLGLGFFQSCPRSSNATKTPCMFHSCR